MLLTLKVILIKLINKIIINIQNCLLASKYMYCWLTNMFYPAIKTLKVKPFKKITLIMRKNCNMHHTVEWISAITVLNYCVLLKLQSPVNDCVSGIPIIICEQT